MQVALKMKWLEKQLQPWGCDRAKPHGRARLGFVELKALGTAAVPELKRVITDESLDYANRATACACIAVIEPSPIKADRELLYTVKKVLSQKPL
jgi:hypothetical protein